MSKEIDWSKAPEGTTHHMRSDKFIGQGWVKVAWGQYYRWSVDDQWIVFLGPDLLMDGLIERPANSAWNGEGLPPVGTNVCIYDPEGILIYGAGESGEVVAHVENTAVVRMSYGLGCFTAKHLRTTEQIAAEERKNFIEDLAAELGGHWSEEAKAPQRNMAAYLYDAGYRKQVTK